MIKMSKKSLAVLTLCSMLVVGLLIGGATLALFTSSATNADNNFTAGTINLTAERNHGDYLHGPMFYSNYLDPDANHAYDVEGYLPSGEAPGGWAPGDTVRRTMVLKNEGTLDAVIAGIKATPRETYTQALPSGGSRTVDGLTSGEAYEEFIQKANVLITNPDSGVMLYEGPLAGLIFDEAEQYAEPLNELVLQGTNPPFAPGPLNVTFEVTLDESAGNVLQGENFIFDFGFLAQQVRNVGDNDVAGSDLRIEVSWVSNNDLDVHLTGPGAGEDRFHVYYYVREYFENGNLHANLVEDFWGPPGPEVINIYNVKGTGMYRYSVFNYDEVGISGSGAQVKVFQNGQLVQSFDVPNGAGDLWTVFEIQDGVIVPINSLSDTEPFSVQSIPATDGYLIYPLIKTY